MPRRSLFGMKKLFTKAAQVIITSIGCLLHFFIKITFGRLYTFKNRRKEGHQCSQLKKKAKIREVENEQKKELK